MPSYSVATMVAFFRRQCDVTGRDKYEIEVAGELPPGSFVAYGGTGAQGGEAPTNGTALTCPFVENIQNEYKGNDFTITIPFKFIPDNTDAIRDVVEMLRNRTDLYCLVCSDHIWIDSC